MQEYRHQGPSELSGDRPSYEMGSQTEVGHSLTPFLGFIAYPYYTITFRGQSPNIHEVGSYIKAPIRVAGPDFNLGGN